MISKLSALMEFMDEINPLSLRLLTLFFDMATAETVVANFLDSRIEKAHTLSIDGQRIGHMTFQSYIHFELICAYSVHVLVRSEK